MKFGVYSMGQLHTIKVSLLLFLSCYFMYLIYRVIIVKNKYNYEVYSSALSKYILQIIYPNIFTVCDKIFELKLIHISYKW